MSAFLGLIACALAPGVLTMGLYIWDKTWTGSAIFLNAWKGSLSSAIFFAIIVIHSTIARQDIFPPQTSGEVVGWLWLSSFLGIVIGDTFWLLALNHIGAFHVILIDSIKPFLAAILAAVFLDESFALRILLGIAITMIGVLLVATDKVVKSEDKPQVATREVGKPSNSSEDVPKPEDDSHTAAVEDVDMSEKPPPSEAPNSKADGTSGASCRGKGFGYACAALNCIFDVASSIITKAHGKYLLTWHINFLRFGFAGAQLFLLIGVALCVSRVRRAALADWCLPATLGWRGWCIMCAGTLLATVCTPGLSQFALFRIDVSIYTTLVSLGPVWSLPVGMVAKGERLTLRAGVGSLMAAGGIVPLAMSIKE